jgi:serine/threonine protein kinase
MSLSSNKLPFPGTPSGSASGLLKKTVLSDRFLLGEELGRGAYGQVYKGVDTTNGDVVAIKQIALGGVTPENLQSVMGEIELLKTLNHKNIVKYLGSFKTRTHLYIILEYMENGSLASVIKPNRYGVLSEALAAAYIGQVLQGLQYLHDQGVVHRDIKGANILTTGEVGHLQAAAPPA